MVRRRAPKNVIRDPKKPKRFLNAFMLFFLKISPTIRHKDKTVTNVASIVGEMWRRLPQKIKDQYKAKAMEGKKLYMRRMSRYRAPSQETLLRMYGVVPKRFLSAYGYFVKQNYDRFARRHPSKNFVKVSKELSKEWKGMSAKERDPYVNKFLMDWRRWRRERHLYEEGHFQHGIYECCKCCRKTGKQIKPNKNGVIKAKAKTSLKK